MSTLAKALQGAAQSNASSALYIEDLFSTYLYTGNGSTQSIVNGIDLAGEGGLVWIKARNNPFGNVLFDTDRGFGNYITSDTAGAENYAGDLGWGAGSFNSDGFTTVFGTNGSINDGTTPTQFASWTFRKSPRFFDVVTWTGNGTSQTIPHNLGVAPGMIVVKNTVWAGQWWHVYHRSLTSYDYVLFLNTTNAEFSGSGAFTASADSSNFYIGNSNGTNASGDTYVAYLFAHDTEADGVIQCGSYTGNGSTTGPVIDLGWEPQFLLMKVAAGDIGNWHMYDNMRELSETYSSLLQANTSNAETPLNNSVAPTSTGFRLKTSDTQWNGSGYTYTYVAIRRGPMRAPTSASEVFKAIAYSGTSSTRTLDPSIVFDVYMSNHRTPSGQGVGLVIDRLRGSGKYVVTYATDAETGLSTSRYFDGQTGFTLNTTADNVSGRTYINYFFRRAPEFMDVVCFVGDYAGNPEIPHNLGVTPELIIAKNRGASGGAWYIHHSALSSTEQLAFNTSGKSIGSTWTLTDTTWKNASAQYPTGENKVAYLFATLAGVSKVGSYTGTASDLNVDCGFSSGAAFVLIKRTDSSGDWYVWDSTRGIVAGNDPYLLLNSTAAEVTSTDYIDPYASGFTVTSSAPAALNASGGTYIYLAIAA